MSPEKKTKINLMVASVVYPFKTDLEQLCATLNGFGYDVINSHIGTVYIPPGTSNRDACLKAVAECDFFLGIILPYYGSGITHEEIQKAVKLNKPRCFLVHHDVTFARKLLEQYMYSDIKTRTRNPDFSFTKTAVLDDIKVIDMYNDAIQDNIPVKKRTNHWAHEFSKYSLDGAPFIDSQFRDAGKLKAHLDALSKGKS